MSTEVTASVETTADTSVTEQQVIDTTTESNEVSQPEVSQDDYSFVPPKFLVDGKPDLKNLTTSYLNLEKKLSQKISNLAPEDVAEYAYEPKYLPNGMEPDAERINQFKASAKELGISTQQYEFMFEQHEQALQQTIEHILPSTEATEAKLKEVWGSEFNDKLESAKAAFKEYAPSDMSIDDPILNHPKVLRLLAAIGGDFKEDSRPMQASKATGMTKEEVEQLMASPDYYSNPETYAKVTSWFQKNYDK